jgi:hypothetical protein
MEKQNYTLPRDMYQESALSRIISLEHFLFCADLKIKLIFHNNMFAHFYLMCQGLLFIMHTWIISLKHFLFCAELKIKLIFHNNLQPYTNQDGDECGILF